MKSLLISSFLVLTSLSFGQVSIKPYVGASYTYTLWNNLWKGQAIGLNGGVKIDDYLFIGFGISELFSARSEFKTLGQFKTIIVTVSPSIRLFPKSPIGVSIISDIGTELLSNSNNQIIRNTFRFKIKF